MFGRRNQFLVLPGKETGLPCVISSVSIEPYVTLVLAMRFLHFSRTFCLFIPYSSENKQLTFPYASFTDWFSR